MKVKSEGEVIVEFQYPKMMGTYIATQEFYFCLFCAINLLHHNELTNYNQN